MTLKRKHPEADIETIFAKAAKASSAAATIRNFLKKEKNFLESAPAKEVHKAARGFTIEDAVSDFNLTYNARFIDAEKHLWRIESLEEFNKMTPSTCLLSFLNEYTEIYDRSSEAGCRVAVDLVLLHCIAQMRGMSGQPTINKVSVTSPNHWEDVKVYCEVSFTHTVDNPNCSQHINVGGHVDRAVGIAFRSAHKPERHFHSLLLCVEAKAQKDVGAAMGQLIVYLASLHQSRINQGKSDSTAYGVATDGFTYIFVTITHEGVLQMGKHFNVMAGDLPTILGCLQYILGKAMLMSPNVSPQIGGPEMDGADDADEAFDVDDNSYLKGDDSDDEYDAV